MARPEQLPPPGDWFVWLIMAGRGWGKSRTAAEWSAAKARRYPGARIALVAATVADARDTMVEGESGLLACLAPGEMRGGEADAAWNRSLGELFLANGSRFKTYSSEKPRKLRGPQHHFAWADEAAFWSDAGRGTVSDTTWSNLVIGTRLPARRGWDAEYRTQICVATTPRPVALLRSRDPDPARAGLTQRETTVITRGTTAENLANLSDTYKAQVVAPLAGTRLGRQELEAEILEDVEGALWTWDTIGSTRVTGHPPLVTVVVAVDPAVTSGEGSDETGIVVAGKGDDGHGYVVADLSFKGSPAEVARRVAAAYDDYQANWVTAEVNQGGDYIGTMIRSVKPDIGYKTVHAARGKYLRAEPIAALFEQGRCHLTGQFSRLEDQMTTFVPGENSESPDRVDAMVYALTACKIEGAGMTWLDVYAPEKDEQGNRKRSEDEPPNPWADAYGPKGE